MTSQFAWNLENNKKQAMDEGIVPILFNILRQEIKDPTLPNSQIIIQYTSNIIEFLINNMDDIPKELQHIVKLQNANKTIFAKQLVDLVDKSGSISCILSSNYTLFSIKIFF